VIDFLYFIILQAIFSKMSKNIFINN